MKQVKVIGATYSVWNFEKALLSIEEQLNQFLAAPDTKSPEVKALTVAPKGENHAIVCLVEYVTLAGE